MSTLMRHSSVEQWRLGFICFLYDALLLSYLLPFQIPFFDFLDIVCFPEACYIACIDENCHDLCTLSGILPKSGRFI